MKMKQQLEIGSKHDHSWHDEEGYYHKGPVTIAGYVYYVQELYYVVVDQYGHQTEVNRYDLEYDDD